MSTYLPAFHSFQLQDINVVNGNGETALHLACRKGYHCCVAILTTSGLSSQLVDPFIYSTEERKCAHDLLIDMNSSAANIQGAATCADLLR